MSRLHTIAAVLTAQQGHVLRDSPYGNTNLSTFTCTCGQVFIPSGVVSSPRSAPSMAALHRAEAVAQAADVDAAQGTAALETRQSVEVAAPGTILRTARGTMVQKSTTPGTWITQAGEFGPDDKVALPAVILWIPEGP